MDTERLGLPFEPRAPESLRKGVQAVATSGDKLLGGPQAGIILGQKGVVGAMRDNPLCRALRVDKVTLAGLEATLRHYLDPEEALKEIPALRMLALPLEELKERARQIQENLEGGTLEVRVEEGSGRVGGGTYPGAELPTWLIRVRPRSMSAETLAARLRAGDPPVVGRREDDEVLMDLRTVEEKDDRTLVRRLLQAAE
jgi:L-seryl-tRNA(Ser) seleniumtransferase